MSGLIPIWSSGWGQVGYISGRLTCAAYRGPLPVQRHQGNRRKWCSESCRVCIRASRRAARPTACQDDPMSTGGLPLMPCPPGRGKTREVTPWLTLRAAGA